MPDVAGDMRTWQPANAEMLGRVLAGLRALPVMRDAARQGDDPVLREQLELLRRLWGHGYLIWHDMSEWCFCRRDGLGGIVSCCGPEKLIRLLAAGWGRKPVRGTKLPHRECRAVPTSGPAGAGQ